MTPHLDSYETELLEELRSVVASRSQPRGRPVQGRLRPVPAYAVTETPSGAVHVKINRLEDAPGLRAGALRFIRSRHPGQRHRDLRGHRDRRHPRPFRAGAFTLKWRWWTGPSGRARRFRFLRRTCRSPEPSPSWACG